MELKILGSSSAGNCYLLDNGKECMMIECGIPFREVQKAVDFDISRITGVLVSHEHGDHARGLEKCLSAQLKCYMSKGTAEALHVAGNRLVKPLRPLEAVRIGNFTVMPFDTQHDAAQPFGYLIYHKECGTVLFATDTYYLRYRFDSLTNILIECNYRQDILDANVDSGRIPAALRERTMRSHFSYDNCLRALSANDLSMVNNIVLIHLSDGNSNAEEFRRGIADETGKNVIVAEKGLTISFNEKPF